MDNFLSLIEEDKRIIEDRLDLVYKNKNEFEKMCAYSFSVGGKRIRAILLLESFKSYKEVSDLALDFAISLELIHNYSLVHDDLPCLLYTSGKLVVIIFVTPVPIIPEV